MTFEERIREEQDRYNELTLQIARFKQLLPPDPSQYDPGEKMELEQLERRKKESAERLAALKRRETGDAERFIVWLGSKREWGDMLLGAYSAGFIQATSALDVLEQAGEHFIWKDANRPDKPLERFKPRSVWQSLKNRDDYQDPQKPDPR